MVKSESDTVTLKFKGREATASGDDFGKLTKGVPEQMRFTFEAQYSDIELKETVRGIKALTREIVRLGGNERIARSTLELLSVKNPVIDVAACAIEEALAD